MQILPSLIEAFRPRNFASAQHVFEYQQASHIYDANRKKETLDSLLLGPNRDIWLQALSNKFGRLAQGNNAGVSGMDAIDFIYYSEVPSD